MRRSQPFDLIRCFAILKHSDILDFPLLLVNLYLTLENDIWPTHRCPLRSNSLVITGQSHYPPNLSNKISQNGSLDIASHHRGSMSLIGYCTSEEQGISQGYNEEYVKKKKEKDALQRYIENMQRKDVQLEAGSYPVVAGVSVKLPHIFCPSRRTPSSGVDDRTCDYLRDM